MHFLIFFKPILLLVAWGREELIGVSFKSDYCVLGALPESMMQVTLCFSRYSIALFSTKPLRVKTDWINDMLLIDIEWLTRKASNFAFSPLESLNGYRYGHFTVFHSHLKIAINLILVWVVATVRITQINLQNKRTANLYKMVQCKSR